MYRVKDLYFMEVKDLQGKRLGFIKDIAINFSEGTVIGFILKGDKFVKKEDVIYFNEIMIAKRCVNGSVLAFSSIKGMEVLSKNNCLIGRVEELIIKTEDWKIQGVIVASGIIRDIFLGKWIINCSDLILGDKNILHTTDNKVQLQSKLKFAK